MRTPFLAKFVHRTNRILIRLSTWIKQKGLRAIMETTHPQENRGGARR